jgi:hypothetical protein
MPGRRQPSIPGPEPGPSVTDGVTANDVGTPEELTADYGTQLWFARRESVPVVLYRVNRRPLPQRSLFAEQPADVFDHFASVLLFGETVETGRRNRRLWRLGNRQILSDRQFLIGQLGYERPDERPTDRYDPEERVWVDAMDLMEATARAPFVFDGEGRLLAVLRHPTFNEDTLPEVFSSLLNRGERLRHFPTTEWDVEPILDEVEFIEWLRAADAIQSVTFVAKVPNPDAVAEFEPVWSRMQERKAKALREIMEARDPEVGLEGIEEDEISQAHIAMASTDSDTCRASGAELGVQRAMINASGYASTQLDPCQTHGQAQY